MKKQAAPSRKLRLSRETLRALQQTDLQRAEAALAGDSVDVRCASCDSGCPRCGLPPTMGFTVGSADA